MAAPRLDTEEKSKTVLSEAHFFSLLTQGNLYTLTPLTDAKGLTKLLVASLQRKIYCIEYSNGRPLMREVPFTYIPGCAEIVSIDAVNRSIIQEDFIVGITIIKKDDTTGQQSCFFNVYSDWDLTCDSALDVVSQNCLPLELKFVPYHLYHTKTYGKSGWETVWLLSGSDNCIHIYQSDDESHGYQEAEAYSAFPEFQEIEGITLCIDVLYLSENRRRITATSGENGKVHMFLVKLESTPIVEASRVMEWDYPSPSVKIFNRFASVAVPEILQAHIPKKDESADEQEISPFIAVANSLESCFVYRDVFNKCQGCLLQDTDINDVVTCCIVCDIDQDGELEVLVGTYGQVILIYKENEETEQWDLYNSVTLPCPVLAMVHCDVMGDGTMQLIVMTTIGIHIFQPDPWELASLLLNRLENLCDQTYTNGYSSRQELKEKQ